MSGTGWTRTAPPKPRLGASDNHISAAALAASATDGPVNSYAKAAQRAVVAQKYADKEVKTMLTTGVADLEVLKPKTDRISEGEKLKRKPRAPVAVDAGYINMEI